LTLTIDLILFVLASDRRSLAVHNLAESEYVLNRLGAAREHAQRMLALSKEQFGDIKCEQLLLARIALYDADLSGAPALAQNSRQRVARGRCTGDAEAELVLRPTHL